MKIAIRHGEETKEFDLEELEEMQIRNIELFLKKQKDVLFKTLLSCCNANRPGASFDRYHEISDMLTQIEVFRFDEQFSSV